MKKLLLNNWKQKKFFNVFLSLLVGLVCVWLVWKINQKFSLFFLLQSVGIFLYKNKGQNIKLTLNTEVYMDIFFHFSRLAAKRYQQLTNTSSITLHLCVCKLEK